MINLGNGNDLITFSSEPFDSSSVRTTIVMRQMAYARRVFFIERPVFSSSGGSTYYIVEVNSNLFVVRPYLDAETSVFEQKQTLQALIKDLLLDEHISHYSLWTDTPTAMPYMRDLSPEVIVYDNVKDHSQTHPQLEKELLQYADEVLTHGCEVHTQPTTVRFAGLGQFKDTYFNI
jgi:hypothetical protein